jgi:hypothetical protein
VTFAGVACQVWVCAWALFSIYTIGLGSVQDKKACAVTNACATLVCVRVALQSEGVNRKRDLTNLYLEVAVGRPPHRARTRVSLALTPGGFLRWLPLLICNRHQALTLLTDGLTFSLCGAGPR